MVDESLVSGIFQSDILIRHALLEGIRQLRANPWLLNSVTLGLTQDPLTKDVYGKKDVDALTAWFRKTNIAVYIAANYQDVQLPSVTIALISSSEAENTTGDIHYTTEEDIEAGEWPDLTAKFTPDYDSNTGTVLVPNHLGANIFPGMNLIDATGTAYEIYEVPDTSTLKIDPNHQLDLNGCTVRSGSPTQIQTLESATFNETYSIGVHVGGEPIQLVYLHSIITFILLWGRQTLLEGRGFQRATFSSSDFAKNEGLGPEGAFSRYISVSGSVMNTWPKARFDRVQGVIGRIKPIGSENLPEQLGPPEDAVWPGENDLPDALTEYYKK